VFCIWKYVQDLPVKATLERVLKKRMKWSMTVNIPLSEEEARRRAAILEPFQVGDQFLSQILWIEYMKRTLAKNILIVVI
jgi:hypothetical protein